MDKYAAAELIRRIPGSGTVAVDSPCDTSFRIGGPADVFIRPETIESAADILKACKENGIPAIVIGNGTNLIVRDKGIRAAVIQLTDNVSRYEVTGEVISAEAGILISGLSRIALEHGLSGLEFPSIRNGGAVCECGAYDGGNVNGGSQTEYTP